MLSQGDSKEVIKLSRARIGGIAMLVTLSVALVSVLPVVFTQAGCPDLSARLSAEIKGLNYVPGPGIEFHELMAASGRTSKGARWDGYRFRASDCVEIATRLETYCSAASARAEFEHRVAGFRQTTNQVDPSGLGRPTLSQERALGFLEAEGTAVIVQVREKHLYWIESRSVAHALEFERREKRSYGEQKSQEAEGESLAFRSVTGPEWEFKNGHSVLLRAFKAPDGGLIRWRTRSFPSETEAENALKDMVKQASITIDPCPVLDRQATRVGERVILFGDDPAKPGLITWTEGKDLHTLESPSTKLALEFERRFPR